MKIVNICKKSEVNISNRFHNNYDIKCKIEIDSKLDNQYKANKGGLTFQPKLVSFSD